MADEHEWEKEDVEVERPVSPVVSARLTPDLAEQLFDLARRRRVAVSALVREALEDYVSGTGSAPATLDITVSSHSPVTLYTGGPGGIGRTGNNPAHLDLKPA